MGSRPANDVGISWLEPPLSLLSSIRTTLTTSFATAPPHTVQRLAELILRPRSHYRFVGPYLRAVDRVVSVSSGADVFPLVGDRSTARPGTQLPNGTSSSGASGSSWNTLLDGDESLGGALLTPIPWLQHDPPDEIQSDTTPMGDAINGTGPLDSDPDTHNRSFSGISQGPLESLRGTGAVTQGELLRQEQEAGIVPTPEPIGRHPRSTTARATVVEEADSMDTEEHPHASGPGEVGVEDMGPQGPGDAPGRFDVDVALGRKPAQPELGTREVVSEDAAEGPPGESHSMDGDVILTDADGRPNGD